MPREPWRDHPEYAGLWRAARQRPDDRLARLVLADWLEEHGHGAAAWRERLHGITGRAPQVDPDTGVARAGAVPMCEGAWRRLLGAPPSDDLLCVFDRDVQAYQYLRRYRGRCGWNLGQSDFLSPTERAHLLAVPRLELLACELVAPDGWDWLLGHLPGLTHLEATAPRIDPARLAGLARLPRLRALTLSGRVTMNTTALRSLPGLRHLSIGPFYYDAERLAALAPNLESLHADVEGLGTAVRWPALRSLRMLPAPGDPVMTTAELTGLAAHARLERLDVRCGRVTAVGIAVLAGLPRLRELTLRFPHDQPLPPLKALAKAPALVSLTVEGQINAARLAEVIHLPRLRSLSLNGVLEGGQVIFTHARNLEEVRLAGGRTQVTGLSALPRLERLDLKHLDISAGAARVIKEACPPWVECEIPGSDG